MTKKPECKPGKPLCTACVQAAGKRPKVIFVTDMDHEANRLREIGNKFMGALRAVGAV